MNNITKKLANHPVGLIIFIWTAVQLFLYIRFGILTGLESEKYIGAADHLIATGSYPEKRYIFYSGITLVIALSKLLHTGYGSVIIVQLSYSLFAHLSFYRALKRVAHHSSLAPLLSTGILCILIPYQTWNLTLYSESFFYSSILLFFSSCIVPDKLSRKNTGFQFLFLLISIFCRPMGILLLPCWLIFLFLKSQRKMKILMIGVFTCGVILLWLVSDYILSSIGDWQVLKPAENGYIICDIPTNDKLDLTPLKNTSPVNQLVSYIGQHPGHFLKMAGKKMNYFFLLSRPYYSAVHNFLLWITCFFLYLPFLLNILRRRSGKPGKVVRILGFSIITIFALAICLQCDDFHSRFHNAIIPVFLYAGFFTFIQDNKYFFTRHNRSV